MDWRLGEALTGAPAVHALAGLLFSQLEKTAVNSRSFLGVLFTAISFLAMGNTSQVAIILGGRECDPFLPLFPLPAPLFLPGKPTLP